MNLTVCRAIVLIFTEFLIVSLSYTYVLLSEGKQAYLSGQFSNDTTAGKAVDGDSTPTFPNMAVTSLGFTVYWYVDLEASRNIHSVTVYYRDEHPDNVNMFRKRFAGFSLYISGDTNFKTGYKCNVNSSYPPLIYNISCQYTGRYVRLYNTRSDKTAILELAEIQVYGCLNSTNYGKDCDRSCSPTCQNNRCNVLSGTCFSCIPGFDLKSNNCACEYKKYGPVCESECGKCKDGQACLSKTGECTNGCTEGYYPPMCNMIDKFRKRFAGFSMYISDDINNRTGFRCPVDSTYPPLMYDIFCQYGGRYVKLYNYRADGQAILELVEVQVFGCLSSASYGVNCENSCPHQCKDGRCNVVDGKCFSCNAAYKGDRCDKECSDGKYGNMCLYVCSEKCKDWAKCNITNGHCESGCMSNYFGFTCNQTCVGVCKDRVNCNQLTGECDKGCHYGYYGADCSHKCSGNCKNNATCNSASGLCDNGCIAGFKSDACNQECSPGRFGAECLGHCSKNCKNGPLCHHISGACKHGCLEGFYSEKCTLSCSGNCLGNKVCNSSSGACEDGCSAGWKSRRCDIECNKYEYGKDCAQKCGKCKNEVRCDKTTGHCLPGCSPGYLTQLCNESCTPGYFGEDCLQKCSGNCHNTIACNVGNGYCDTGCENGWRGAQCDEAVMQDDQSNTSQLVIGMASGAGIVILLIIMAVLGLLLIRKLRNNDQRSKSKKNKGSAKDGYKTNDTEGSQADDRTTITREYVNLALNADQNAQRNNTENTDYQKLSEPDNNTYDIIHNI